MTVEDCYGEFKKYWIETGTPSFLVEVMKRTDYDVTCIASAEADSTLLTDIDTVFYNPVPLLYQSGYFPTSLSHFTKFIVSFNRETMEDGYRAKEYVLRI